jgi:hypothetical protein
MERPTLDVLFNSNPENVFHCPALSEYCRIRPQASGQAEN